MNFRICLIFYCCYVLHVVSAKRGYSCTVCQHTGSEDHRVSHVCGRPPPPNPGYIRCNYESTNAQCTGECPSGFKFPDGRTKIEIQCSSNDAVWYPIRKFPDCVSQNYPYDQHVQQPSDNLNDHSVTLSRCKRPNAPSYGSIRCSYDSENLLCTAQCNAGYYFPGGQTELQLQCNMIKASWYPRNSFPDCIGRNENHGTNNQDYQGNNNEALALTLSRCQRPPSPAPGRISCTYDQTKMTCVGSCDSGYYFPNGRTEMTLQCSTRDAYWYPQENFPNCVTRDHINRVTQEGNEEKNTHAVTLIRCGKPEPPRPGVVNCKYDAVSMNCTGTCKTGYYFPNGKRELILQCRTENGVWFPRKEYPTCTQFDNERYTDSSQQQPQNSNYQLEVTLTRCGRKTAPSAGYVNCKYDGSGMNCTGTCATGYYFPGGRRELLLQCRTASGYWYPHSEFPACEKYDADRFTDSSQPPNENHQLQVTLSRCGRKGAPSAGYSNCKYDALGMNCTGTCATGYYFPGGRRELLLQCKTASGYWYPHSEFPSCERYDQDRYPDTSTESPLAVTLSKCKAREAPAGGRVDCRYDKLGMNCTGTCSGGYFSGRRTEIVLQCRTDLGYWFPYATFPSCTNQDYEDVQTTHEDKENNNYALTLRNCRKPESPQGGVSYCKYDTVSMNCTGTCRVGYYFPNGQREMLLQCRTENGVWYPRRHYPACSQFASENYTDATRRQLEVTLARCGSKTAPTAGYVNCKYDALGMNCTGTCTSGYYFPRRRTEMVLQCRTDSGQWYPENEFPSCEKYIRDYTDQQKPEHINRLLQVTLSKCGRKDGPRAGYVNCKYDASGMNCSGSCSPGYVFPDGSSEVILRCRTEDGYWFPRNEFPSCEKLDNEKYEEETTQQVNVEDNQLIQVTLSKCGKQSSPSAGYVHCKYDAIGMNCTGTCRRGYYFPGKRSELLLQCKTENGEWHPRREFPSCSRYDNEMTGGFYDRNEQEEGRRLTETLNKCGRKTAPENGYVNCTYDAVGMNCTGTCKPNYYFPGGKRTYPLQCHTDYGVWSPRNEFPTCIKFIHDKYEEEKPDEDNNPLKITLRKCGHRDPPLFGRVDCRYDTLGMNCTGACKSGYFFPDGKRDMTVQCKTYSGVWYPQSEFPECSEYDSETHTDTTQQESKPGEENDQLQVTLSRCIKRSDPVSGYVFCRHNDMGMNCSGLCRRDYYFPNGERRMVLQCKTDTGLWYPRQEFPICSKRVEPLVNGGNENVDTDGQQTLDLDENPCGNKPNPPLTGFLNCVNYSHALECTGTCMPGYTFSNGNSAMTLSCSSGRWTPFVSFPPCYLKETTTSTSDETNLEPPEDGNSYDNIICPKPSTPKGGYIHCEQLFSKGYRKCTGTCMPGFSFTNGENTMILRCSSIRGWLPASSFPTCKENKDQLYRPDSERPPTETTNQNGNIDAPGHTFTGDDNSDTSNRGNTGYETVIRSWGYCRQITSPQNGFSVCSGSEDTIECTGKCKRAFQFPYGESKIVYRCDKRNGRWSPRSEFPDCKSVCDVPCNNGGVCVRPNQCVCPQDYRGNFCQYPLSNCDPHHLKFAGSIRCNHTNEETTCTLACPQTMMLEPSYAKIRCSLEGYWSPRQTPRCVEDPRYKDVDSSGYPCSNSQCTSMNLHDGSLCQRPPPPKPGQIRCIYNRLIMECTSKCADGYRFPNGEREEIRTCDNRTGAWSPRERYTDCEPICERQCLNGGKCLAPNFCYCPIKFRGNQCQHPLSNCDPYRLRFAGSIKCSHSSEETVCKLGCPEGTVLDDPYYETVRCSLEGEWSHQHTPRCVEVDSSGRMNYDSRYSNLQLDYTQNSQNNHRQHSSENSDRYAQHQRLTNYENEDSVENHRTDKEHIRDSELEKESYEQRMKHIQEEEQRRLYERLLKEGAQNRQTESSTHTDSDSYHKPSHHFKNYENLQTNTDKHGRPSSDSDSRHSGEEEISGYGHRFFHQRINQTESYREHSAQQHYYHHQVQRTGHKTSDKRTCMLCSTG